jgi:hypothetical protein
MGKFSFNPMAQKITANDEKFTIIATNNKDIDLSMYSDNKMIYIN